MSTKSFGFEHRVFSCLSMGTPTIPRLAQHVVASVCDVRRARGEMIGVDKIEDIRRRARRGEPIASIARAVGVSEPTARKYARMDDLSPEPPRRRKPESEVLAPYEGMTGPGPMAIRVTS